MEGIRNRVTRSRMEVGPTLTIVCMRVRLCTNLKSNYTKLIPASMIFDAQLAEGLHFLLPVPVMSFRQSRSQVFSHLNTAFVLSPSSSTDEANNLLYGDPENPAPSVHPLHIHCMLARIECCCLATSHGQPARCKQAPPIRSTLALYGH
jgi:hypothetical protein